MKYNKLGSSGLEVSEVCLGTMMWGSQNTEEQAHEQLDYAISRGLNFVDVSEIYPIPFDSPDHEPGMTEKIIGTYITKHPEIRSKLILATKVIGYQEDSRVPLYRSDSTSKPADRILPTSHLDKESVIRACDASLKRLQTNYIDLYQIHWPERYIANFGSRSYEPKYERNNIVSIEETLRGIKELLDNGKIKHYGISNESCFGLCEYVRISKELEIPKPVSIQNSFCLLDRQFEIELAEACSPSNFHVSLLPWGVLAGGLLSGDYHVNSFNIDDRLDARHKDLKHLRFVKFPNFQKRFTTDVTMLATQQYMEIADKYHLSLTCMALSFCKSRWYIPSTIISATTIDELKQDLDAFDVDLQEEVLQEIDEIHNMNKDPIVKVQHLHKIP